MTAIHSSIEVLRDINRAIGAMINGNDYFEEELLTEIGYLPIHESYEAQIMQVLQEFAGRYEIKRAVFSVPDDEGNVTITWEKVI